MAKFNLQSVKRWVFEPKQPPTAIGLAPGNGFAVIADAGGNVSMLDRTGREVMRARLPHPAFDLEVTSNAEFIALLCEDKKLRVINGRGEILWDAKVDIGAAAVDISSRAGLVVVGSARKTLQLFRLDGEPRLEKKLEFTIFDIAFAPAGFGFAAVSTTGDVGFFEYDGTERWKSSIGRRCRGVDVSENGRFIILPVYEGGIRAYNLDGSYIGEYDVMAEVICASINASGKLIFLADEKNRLILLSKNAEVIWNMDIAKPVLSVKTDFTGALCLALVEGGEVIFLELVADETPYFDFLEFPSDSMNMDAKLLWKKDFRPILPHFDAIQTDISPDGGYIAVLGEKKISLYDDTSLLKWNDVIDEPNPVICSSREDNHFFVNTSSYLYRYSYRHGRRWKQLLKFDHIYTPLEKGNLFATAGNVLFAVNREGEILWSNTLPDKPIATSPAPDGLYLGLRYADGTVEVYNSSGGLTYKNAKHRSSGDIVFFGSCLALLLSGKDIIGIRFPALDETVYSSPDEIKTIMGLGSYLVLYHSLGGVTILDNQWNKKMELPDEKGRLITARDRQNEPLLIRITDNVLKMYNRNGSEQWSYSADKKIDSGSFSISGGLMVFFAGSELYCIDLGYGKKEAELIKYLEFSSKRGIYG
jgi:outer membrane protein assembly factor BamB